MFLCTANLFTFAVKFYFISNIAVTPSAFTKMDDSSTVFINKARYINNSFESISLKCIFKLKSLLEIFKFNRNSKILIMNTVMKYNTLSIKFIIDFI